MNVNSNYDFMIGNINHPLPVLSKDQEKATVEASISKVREANKGKCWKKTGLRILSITGDLMQPKSTKVSSPV